MARVLNDLLKLSGSTGGLTFVQDSIGTIAKTKAEKSSKKLSKGTKKSNVEFGGGSMAVKSLRRTLDAKKLGLEDQYFSGRLSGMMRKVVALGEGAPGQRKLNLRKNGAMLEMFEFIDARPLVYSVGGIKEKATLNAARNEIYWTSPTLSPKQQITAPQEATHFKFILGAATVSNYAYNTGEKKYLPAEPNFRNLCAFTESEAIPLKQKTIAPLTLSLTLAEAVVVPEEVAVVTVVGVSFFRNVNGELLEIKDTGGMRVLGVG